MQVYKTIPLISVIITTFKRLERLESAIKSVLNQTYKNVEIIVVDDNANEPKYRKKVEEIISKYPTVKYIQNSENLGGALSRNVGIEAAQGEFVSFLDDDDIYEKEKLEEQYNYYLNHEKDNVGLIYCYSSRVDSHGNNLGYYKANYEGNPLFQHMLESIAGTSLWFCPKNVLLEVGKFEDTPSKQDSILLLKLLAAGFNVYRVPKILVQYTEHDGNRISGLKLSNILGVCNFREWCRKYYNKLNKSQQDQVEYRFSKELIPLYLYNNHNKLAIRELKSMMEISLFRKDTLKSLLKCVFSSIYIRFLRHRNRKE